MPYVPLARQSKAAPYNGERMLNVFARPSDVVSQLVALGRSGLTEVASLGHVRAMEQGAEAYYLAAGGALWKWDGATATRLGTVADDPQTTLAISTGQVAVAAGGKLYLWDGLSLSEPATGAIDTVSGVVYLNGYFVAWGQALGRPDGFQVSALRDGKTWDALDILFAQAKPDAIRALAVYSDRLFAFGQDTIEIWYDAGAATGVFQRDGTPVIPVGIREPKSAVADIAGLFFIGSDGKVRQTQGVQVQPISTPEIEAQLTGVTGAFMLTDRGQKFYCIRREDAPALCYDTDTGLWSERNTGVDGGAWIATAAAGDYVGTTSGISTQSPDVFTDHGQTVRAEIVTTPVEAGGDYVRISRLEVKAKTGRRNLTTEPQIMLEASKDGQTWGQERWRGMGGFGDYKKQIKWHGLGASRWWQFRLRITDATDRDIYGVTYG